jgi:hypothetical protein
MTTTSTTPCHDLLICTASMIRHKPCLDQAAVGLTTGSNTPCHHVHREPSIPALLVVRSPRVLTEALYMVTIHHHPPLPSAPTYKHTISWPPYAPICYLLAQHLLLTYPCIRSSWSGSSVRRYHGDGASVMTPPPIHSS